MREHVNDFFRLQHILEAIETIEEYSEDKALSDVQSDKMLRHALTYNIQVIGEAANHLTKEFCIAHPLTNWRAICGMRNVLVHDYYQIDAEELWNVVVKDIQPLKFQINQYLSE